MPQVSMILAIVLHGLDLTTQHHVPDLSRGLLALMMKTSGSVLIWDAQE